MRDSESKAGLVLLGIYLAWILLILAFNGAIIYVIWHFISKYW